MADENDPTGLDRDYGAAPTDKRQATGSPGAPAAAATESMADLEQRVGDARNAQAEREADDRDGAEKDVEAHPSCPERRETGLRAGSRDRGVCELRIGSVAMINYDLDEQATLREGGPTGPRRASGTLRDLISLSLTWDIVRFDQAHISTPSDRAFGPAEIEAIGEAEDIQADEAAGQSS